MDATGAAAAIAMIVLLVILAVGAVLARYSFMGWSRFSYGAGDNPSWAPKSPADPSRLRFKDCVFTVKRRDGVAAAHDVTAVLNGMAAAAAAQARLGLTRPLNPFSFVIAGFNDRASVPDPSAAPWCSASPPCIKDSDCPYGTVPGACLLAQGKNAGSCVNCPGGAEVSLTGKVRTI